MRRAIRILSNQTINLIAAGEVIENPASVVKELVENAIDAKSTAISIEIREGGQQQIRVADDGMGMSRKGALLCLQRHATSKLEEAADLMDLGTMGFRGEALASIVAASRCTLSTAIEGGEGTSIEIEGGDVKSTERCSRTSGTTIEVRNLFYNTPARRKFQKSPRANRVEIQKMVTLLALAHPEITFTLIDKEETLLLAHGCEGNYLEKLTKRAETLLGKGFAEESFPLEFSLEGGGKVCGLVGKPIHTRHNRSGQYLIVNRRSVVAPSIGYAVQNGYGTRLSERRYPIYFLHIEIPPKDIDVNVHPQKKEVRFREEQLLKKEIERGVQRALSGEGKESVSFPSPSRSFAKEETFNYVEPSFAPIQQEYKECNLEKKSVESSSPLLFREEEEKQEENVLLKTKPRSLGIFSHYLLLEANSVADRVEEVDPPFGILLIDLLAAKARIAFSSVLDKSKEKEQRILLLPITVELSPFEVAKVEIERPFFSSIGIEMRLIGSGSILIEEIPSFLQEEEAVEVVHSILSMDHKKEPLLEREKKLARKIAQVIRREKKPFLVEEGIEIFEQLLLADAPYQCPLGKSTMVHMSEKSIEKFFSQSKSY